MKFGKYLASRQLELPEYLGHFINYKALKKLIKHLGLPAASWAGEPMNPEAVQNQLKESKASFFFKVERELDKVNCFYLEKQANLTVNLDLLMLKKNELLHKTSLVALDTHENNFRDSILYLNLYQSFKKLHQDLSRLQQFVELNEAGFSKVVKKWDKRSKSHTKELFIQTAVNVQPVFHRTEINHLSDLVTSSLLDLESIMDGDHSILAGYRSGGFLDSAGGAVSRNNSTSLVKLADYRKADSHSASPAAGQLADVKYEPAPQLFEPPSRSLYSSTEIDGLYSSFVSIASTKIPDIDDLRRWCERVQASEELPHPLKEKFSKIFLLSIVNLKIPDSFLETFLSLIDYNIDFNVHNDEFNLKPIIHECCSIPPASLADELHVVINNGVKVVNSNDSVNHSRVFIVEHILKSSSKDALTHLLADKDSNGRTCLHYASQNNRMDLLKILLPYFPVDRIDELDNESMSALLLAIKSCHFDVIAILLQSGANCYPESNDSKLQYLPINYVCKFGDYKTLEFLLNSSTPTPEMINRQDVEGLFPLHAVARAGNYKLIKLLIQYGANINQADSLNDWPPIFYSALKGHAQTTYELIKFGARLDIIDENGYDVLYYCVIEGHVDVLNHLLWYKKEFSKNKATLHAQDTESGVKITSLILDEVDLDNSGESAEKIHPESIPHLELPPPILPLRRYGHSFLEQKVLIELMFPIDSNCINLFNYGTESQPGRITITSNVSDIVPRNILLPVTEGQKGTASCNFQTEVDILNEFRIDLEIFPKFGTRLIAKTTALNFSQVETLSPEINSISLPLFDMRLKNIGELNLRYQVIFPFAGTLLETTKYDTYWKSSTCFVKQKPALPKLNLNGGSPNVLSPGNVMASPNKSHTTKTSDINTPLTSAFVTSTSLSGEYLKVKVCLLNDGTPVACPHWAITVAENIEMFLPNISLHQLNSMTSNLFDYEKVLRDLHKMKLRDLSLVKKLLKIIYIPLDIILDTLDPSINLSMELIFPSLFEIENLPFAGNIHLNLNKFIDQTLNCVFNHIRSIKRRHVQDRSLIFLSSNSIVCKILNWKQPNIPVFLVMNGIVYKSSKGEFEARSANGLLLGELEEENGAEHSPSPKPKYQVLANDQELTIRSIKEATNFILDNNLIGVITSIHLLNLVPKLVPLIRSRGLVLVASGDLGDTNLETSYNDLDTYTRTEINGLRFDDILSFKDSSLGEGTKFD